MNGILIVGAVGLVVLVAAVAMVNRQSVSAPEPASSSSKPRDFETIHQEVVSGRASLYDVRTPEEFASGAFDQAVNLPLQSIQAGSVPKEAKDSKIYLYCRSGNRSSQAASELEKAGYINVIDLGGLGDVEKIGGNLK